jgi:hypothetical protein
MAACSYVGRVGGLAIALGVGSALLGGTAVGWADDAGTGPSTDRSSSTQSSNPAGTASSVGTRGRAATVAGRSGEAPRSAATVSPRRGQSADAVQPEFEPEPRVSALIPRSGTPVEQSAAVVARDDFQPPVEAPAPVEVPAATAANPAAAVESAPPVVAASQSVPVTAVLPPAPVATQPISAPASAPVRVTSR